MPPAIRKFDQVVVNAKRLPFGPFRRQHRIKFGIVDDIGLTILGQALAEAIGAKNANQFRMANIAVVALAIILHHQLPVGVLDQIILHRNLAAFEVIDRNLRRDVGLDPVNWRRRVGHADEDQPGDILHRHRRQAVIGLVEIRPHVARRQ